MAYTTKKRSKIKVYIYRVFVLSIICAISYGAYTGYQYMKPKTVLNTATVSAQSKELEAIKDSAKFKAKMDNLAQQELLTKKIADKKQSILTIENEQKELEKELEAKRVESLSL